MSYQQGLIEGFLLAHQAPPHILTALHELVGAIPDEAAAEEEAEAEEVEKTDGEEQAEEEAAEQEAAPDGWRTPVTPGRRLTNEQKAEILRLYSEEGWGSKRIAEYFGKTQSAMQQLLWKLKQRGVPPGK